MVQRMVRMASYRSLYWEVGQRAGVRIPVAIDIPAGAVGGSSAHTRHYPGCCCIHIPWVVAGIVVDCMAAGSPAPAVADCSTVQHSCCSLSTEMFTGRRVVKVKSVQVMTVIFVCCEGLVTPKAVLRFVSYHSGY